MFLPLLLKAAFPSISSDLQTYDGDLKLEESAPGSVNALIIIHSSSSGPDSPTTRYTSPLIWSAIFKNYMSSLLRKRVVYCGTCMYNSKSWTTTVSAPDSQELSNSWLALGSAFLNAYLLLPNPVSVIGFCLLGEWIQFGNAATMSPISLGCFSATV